MKANKPERVLLSIIVLAISGLLAYIVPETASQNPSFFDIWVIFLSLLMFIGFVVCVAWTFGAFDD